MICPKCNGKMEENRIRTHLLWIDEIHQIPDEEEQLGPTIAYVCKECGYMEFYREKNSNKGR